MNRKLLRSEKNLSKDSIKRCRESRTSSTRRTSRFQRFRHPQLQATRNMLVELRTLKLFTREVFSPKLIGRLSLNSQLLFVLEIVTIRMGSSKVRIFWWTIDHRVSEVSQTKPKLVSWKGRIESQECQSIWKMIKVSEYLTFRKIWLNLIVL